MTLAEDVLKRHVGVPRFSGLRCRACDTPHPCEPYRLAVMVQKIGSDRFADELAGHLYVASHQDHEWAQSAWDDMGGSEPTQERCDWAIAVWTFIRAALSEVSP